MSMQLRYPHLTFNEPGVPRIAGTRYKVLQLAAEHYHHGWTAEELLRQHPDLRPEEVYAALTYFYDHHQAMIGEMNASAIPAESARLSQPLSRDELLQRNTKQEP